MSKTTYAETKHNVGFCVIDKLAEKYEIKVEKYKNKELAVAAYNAGIGTVDTWIEKGIIKQDGSDIENIPFKETNNYVRKILKNYEIYNKLYK